MAKNTTHATAVQPVMEAATAAIPNEMHRADAIDGETFAYAIEGETPLERLNVINRFFEDIESAETANGSTVANAEALKASVLRRKDAAVLAIAGLLATTPETLVKARLHAVYGGEERNGKTSPTTPNDGGLLKAALAYRSAMTYCESGIVPDAWNKGKGLRGAIAECLEAADRHALATEIEGKSKVGVSDVISRFFREFTPKSAPVWMNIEKLAEMVNTLYANQEYVKNTPELVAAYEALASAARDCVNN